MAHNPSIMLLLMDSGLMNTRSTPRRFLISSFKSKAVLASAKNRTISMKSVCLKPMESPIATIQQALRYANQPSTKRL